MKISGNFSGKNGFECGTSKILYENLCVSRNYKGTKVAISCLTKFLEKHPRKFIWKLLMLQKNLIMLSEEKFWSF